MESELQRLRFRIRQLEREVRALRTAARQPAADPGKERPGTARRAPTFARRRVLQAPSIAGPEPRET